MKKLILLFVSLFIPCSVFADHHLVYISKIIKMSATSCGIELTISADNQNGFDATDNVTLGSTILTDFTDVTDPAHININADSANNDTGDTILTGNGAFNSLLIPQSTFVDLLYTVTSPCTLFVEGAAVKFINDGTTLIDTATLPTGFGNNTAFVRTSHSDTGTLVDLTATSTTVKDNVGTTATINSTTVSAGSGGTSGASGSGGTGGSSATPSASCQLTKQ